jgi:molybdopterin/thiamine biosynthesis adenylyltransferase
MVIDPDEIDPSNLTRIHESRMSDSGRPKVDVAERLGADLGVGQLVESTVGRVNTIAVARQLVDCDVVFGCTDDHAGRSVLSRLAYWYLIPVIDMGVVIDAEAPGAAGVFGRVSVVQPGTACLICRGVVDPVRVREESLPEAERESLRREGYVRGLDAPDPSVISFTTLVASWSVGELLQRMFTESDDMPPSELLFRIHDRRIGTRVPQPQEGHYCGDASVWGSGDEASFLGQVW